MMSAKPTLVVMAAGIGSRYGGLKQLEPIGAHGEGLIDYSVYDAQRAGFGRIVFIIRREIEQDFKEIIGAKHDNRLPIDYAFQELNDIPSGFTVPEDRHKPWGTAQAILVTEPLIHEPFAVINGDDFYGLDAYETLASYLREIDTNGLTFAAVGYVLRNTLSEHGTVSRGVCEIDSDGNLEKVVEQLKIEKDGMGARVIEEDGRTSALEGDEIVSMNMFGFTPAIFPILRERFVTFLENHIAEPKAEFLLPREVDYMIQNQLARVKVLTSSATWFGITHKEDKEFVMKSIQALVHQGVYPPKIS